MARAQWNPPAPETTPSLQSPFRNQLWLPAERPERSTPVTGATRTPQVDLSGLSHPSPVPAPEETAPGAAPPPAAAEPAKEVPPAPPPAEEAPVEEASAEGATSEGQPGKKGKKKAAGPKAGE